MNTPLDNEVDRLIVDMKKLHDRIVDRSEPFIEGFHLAIAEVSEALLLQSNDFVRTDWVNQGRAMVDLANELLD